MSYIQIIDRANGPPEMETIEMTNTITRTETAYAGKAWFARITGRDEKYGFQRDFLAKRDVTVSRSNTYRQIEFIVPLDEGALYERSCQEAARRNERRYYQVRDGRLVQIERQEVEGLL